jgi:transposase-like protein
MYVRGVSTRKVTEVMRELCGLEVSSTQVSRATQLLDEELSRWRNRPIGEVPYVFVDARYEKIRHGGSVVSCAVLMAFGVDESGHRTVLGVSVSLSEAEVHWRDFFAHLQGRGLSGVRLLISDDHAGLKTAREARFPGVPWQRCQFHLSRMPAITYRASRCAARWRQICAPSLNLRTGRKRSAFAPGRGQIRTAGAELSAWMEVNVAESFTVQRGAARNTSASPPQSPR